MEALEALKAKAKELDDSYQFMETKLNSISRKLNEKKEQQRFNKDKEFKLLQAIDLYKQKSLNEENKIAELQSKKELIQLETSVFQEKIIELERLIHATIKDYELTSGHLNQEIRKTIRSLEAFFRGNTNNMQEIIKDQIEEQKVLLKMKSSIVSHHPKERIPEPPSHEADLSRISANMEQSSSPFHRDHTIENFFDRETQQNSPSDPIKDNLPKNGKRIPVSATVLLPVRSDMFRSNQPWFKEHRKRKFQPYGLVEGDNQRFINSFTLLQSSLNNSEAQQYQTQEN